MSGFDDAMTVLDTLATIADTAMTKRYQYVTAEKNHALDEEKFELSKERDQWNRDKYILDGYQTNINVKNNKSDHDSLMTSLDEFIPTITDPKLKELGATIANSKIAIGEDIDNKEAWAKNVQRIMTEHRELKDDVKSGNIAGIEAFPALANEMLDGINAYSEFTTASDEARYADFAKQIESFGNTANFLGNYDASHPTMQVNMSEEPIRVASPDGMITVMPGEQYMVNQFDLDEAYKEYPVFAYGTDIPVTNQYAMLKKSLDYLQSGNDKEAMMSMRKVNPKFHDDLSTAAKDIRKYRDKTVAAWNANLDGADDPENNRLGREYTKVKEMRDRMDVIRTSDEYMQQPGHESKVEYLKLQMDMFYEETELNPTDLNYATFRQHMGIVRSGKFIPADYDNWLREAKSNRNRHTGVKGDEYDERLSTSKIAFDRKMRTIGAAGSATSGTYIHDVIKDMAGEWDVPLGEVSSDGGVKEITNYQSVMDMNTKLHSKLYSSSMGEQESSGPWSQLWTGAKNSFTKEDLAKMEASPLDLSQKRIKNNIAARVINNPHWIPEIGTHVTEQLGWNWPLSDVYPGPGKTEKNVASFEALKLSKDYFNKAYTGSIIQRTANNDPTGKSDLTYLVNSMMGERQSRPEKLTKKDELRTGSIANFSKFRDKDGTHITNGVYFDLKNMNPEDPRWVNQLRSHWYDKVLHGGFEVESVYKKSLNIDGKVDATSPSRMMLELNGMWVTELGKDPQTNKELIERDKWVQKYLNVSVNSKLTKEGQDKVRREMLYEMRKRQTPSFLFKAGIK